MMHWNNFLRGACLFCLAALVSGRAAALPVSLVSDRDQVAVGDTLGFDLVLESPFAGDFAGDTLAGFGFDLSFDDSLLAFLGPVITSPWQDDSAFFDDTDVAASAFPGVGDEGQPDLLLARLVFSVLDAGEFAVSVASDSAGSVNQGLFYLSGIADFQATSATVTAQARVVPLPATLGLFLLGALVAVRRSR